MIRTLSLLTLALLAHLALVAALAHACGPNCGLAPTSNHSNQLNITQFQLGNRPNLTNKNVPSVFAETTKNPQPKIANQPATIQPTAKKPQEQSTEHPSDLPTNDPPVAALAARK